MGVAHIAPAEVQAMQQQQQQQQQMAMQQQQMAMMPGQVPSATPGVTPVHM